MSFKEKFNNVTNPKLNELILDYFDTYYHFGNFGHGVYFYSTNFSEMHKGIVKHHICYINTLFDKDNKEINYNGNIHKHSMYKLIDKLDNAKVDCSKFDNSQLLNILRLSKVAYDFAINTSKIFYPVNEKNPYEGLESNYNVLNYYKFFNISFEKYKKSADEVMKDVDVYHDQIVKWYKKNKKSNPTSIWFGYSIRERLRKKDLCDKVEKTLIELVRCGDEKFLLVENYNMFGDKILFQLTRSECKMDSLINFRHFSEGCSIYMYLLVEYIIMTDDVIDTSKYTDDDIIELVKEYNSIYESIMKPLLEKDLKLRCRLDEYQRCPQGKTEDLKKDFYPTMKVFFNAFLDKALSKMKN